MRKAVLAFYYPWYWTREFSGHWSMWDYGGRHNPEIRAGGRRDVSCPHYPDGGPYDSNEPRVIRRHFETASALGIDGFVVSWWGKGNILNRPFGKLLDYAREMDTKVTAYYETVPSLPFKHKNTALDLIEFINEYGHSPGFFKTGGKPVIFFYRRMLRQHSLRQWAEIIRTVRRESDALLIADIEDHDYIGLFDGAHTYSPYEKYLWRVSPQKAMEKLVSACRRDNKLSGISVMPGFDDRPAGNEMSLKRRLFQRFVHFKRDVVVDREGGLTYGRLWEWAIKSSPDWVLICSFNEWIEGTEIEPSVEFGNLYLDMTRKYIGMFKDFQGEQGDGQR